MGKYHINAYNINNPNQIQDINYTNFVGYRSCNFEAIIVCMATDAVMLSYIDMNGCDYIKTSIVLDLH